MRKEIEEKENVSRDLLRILKLFFFPGLDLVFLFFLIKKQSELMDFLAIRYLLNFKITASILFYVPLIFFVIINIMLKDSCGMGIVDILKDCYNDQICEWRGIVSGENLSMRDMSPSLYIIMSILFWMPFVVVLIYICFSFFYWMINTILYIVLLKNSSKEYHAPLSIDFFSVSHDFLKKSKHRK